MGTQRTDAVFWKGSGLMPPSGKKSSNVRARKRRKKTPVRRKPSVLDLVRSGVERFILKDANMRSFRTAILRAAKKGETSKHPLTGAAFRRIVRKAIRDRKLSMGGAPHKGDKPDRENST